MISYTNKRKPLALSWGRTPRLDSGIRVSEILGFPSISVTLLVVRVGPLSAKDPLAIVIADTDCLLHTCCGSALSAITDFKSVLTQKSLDIFCQKYYIPEEVHPQLPNRNQTIHERPTGKIGVYTRFFEYANFRLSLSTFLVDVLRHFRINLSQLFVIAVAKVSHFEVLCRVHDIQPMVGLFRCFYVNSKNKEWMSFSKRSDSSGVCYTKPLDSLKHWNEHFFQINAFACPVSFLWHTDKNVVRDPLPKSSEFNANDYTVIVAYPAPFLHDNDEGGCLLLCLIFLLAFELVFDYLFVYADMDLLAFIRTADPTKVKIGERQHAKDEPKLLDSTVRRVVPLLTIAPDRSEGELEASVDKLFDEGGSTEQGDSTVGG
ncbi:hypothetical protein Tco_1298771 [Tanacetum coccineum]